MEALHHNVKIYIPSEANGKPLTGEQLEDTLVYVATRLSQELGGATATQGVGYWEDDTGELIIENVRLVQAFTNDLDKANELGKELAGHIRDVLQQQAAAFEIDGSLIIIS